MHIVSPWGSLMPAVQERAWDWGGWHPMWGAWGTWGLAMMLMMLVFWALVLVGLILGLRWLARQSRPDAALEILRQRYARGEINKDEFEAKKRDLEGR